ncbi:MAG: M23 family metallopeptidase [Candidatus Aenigmarchaeota archaeon]|nr:M23 family metallopeptidase [Candidatus Aenigmarchaeota archaeon]
MIHLIGKSNQYAERRKEGRLPRGLGKFKYSIPWPIDTETPNLHLSCYFGEVNYADPLDKTDRHNAIDIQVPYGTPVLSPEKSKVVFLDTYSGPKGLVDMLLWGIDSKIVYLLCHLDGDSVPYKVRKRRYSDRYTRSTVDSEEFIGKVGRWPKELTKEVKIPQDVERVYGREYHHLHFQTNYEPNEYGFGFDEEKNGFNPLLILKNLLNNKQLTGRPILDG